MKVALAQMRSTEDRAENLRQTETLILEGAASGADLVALPENFAWLRSEGVQIPCAEPLDGPLVSRLSRLASENRIWLLAGSLPEAIPGSHKAYNTSVLFDRGGSVVGVYRKIHLFDANLPGASNLTESDAVEPGSEVVVVPTEFGPLGLSICYDLRFPELYRRQSLSGARLLAVPSAFTERTGRDHWEVLLRARAVENQCIVIAPAQWGRHSDRRASWGHSLAVDPWGRIVAEKPEGTGLLLADLDLTEVDRVRAGLPALSHARLVGR